MDPIPALEQLLAILRSTLIFKSCNCSSPLSISIQLREIVESTSLPLKCRQCNDTICHISEGDQNAHTPARGRGTSSRSEEPTTDASSRVMIQARRSSTFPSIKSESDAASLSSTSVRYSASSLAGRERDRSPPPVPPPHTSHTELLRGLIRDEGRGRAPVTASLSSRRSSASGGSVASRRISAQQLHGAWPPVPRLHSPLRTSSISNSETWDTSSGSSIAGGDASISEAPRSTPEDCIPTFLSPAVPLTIVTSNSTVASAATAIVTTQRSHSSRPISPITTVETRRVDGSAGRRAGQINDDDDWPLPSPRAPRPPRSPLDLSDDHEPDSPRELTPRPWPGSSSHSPYLSPSISHSRGPSTTKSVSPLPSECNTASTVKRFRPKLLRSMSTGYRKVTGRLFRREREGSGLRTMSTTPRCQDTSDYITLERPPNPSPLNAVRADHVQESQFRRPPGTVEPIQTSFLPADSSNPHGPVDDPGHTSTLINSWPSAEEQQSPATSEGDASPRTTQLFIDMSRAVQESRENTGGRSLITIFQRPRVPS